MDDQDRRCLTRDRHPANRDERAQADPAKAGAGLARSDEARITQARSRLRRPVSLSISPIKPRIASPVLVEHLGPSHIGAMNEPAVRVENLVKRYPTAVAVDGISFTVRRGVTAALLGGNGAGKTTTLSILLGLLLPSAGKVQVLGEDMLRHRYRVLPRMNFSSPFVDLPHRLTVRQNLSIYARLYGLPRRRERIERLADDLQIGAFLERPAGKLSAGQKTRVALAKALLNEPEALIDRYGRTNLEEVFLHIARGSPAELQPAV